MFVNIENIELFKKYNIILKSDVKNGVIVNLANSTDDVRIPTALFSCLLGAIKSANVSKNVSKNDTAQSTFGVELEFVGSKNSLDIYHFNQKMLLQFGENYDCTYAYSRNKGNSWILGRDSSINTAGSLIEHPYGYELSTPKLNLFNKEDLTNLQTVLNYIKEDLYGEVNKSCGTHIHIGLDPKLNDKIFGDDIRIILAMYANMEKRIFDPIVPRSRRCNRYCKVTVPILREKYRKLSARYCTYDRYHDFECNNLHFEFRQLEGTLDFNTIINWTKLQLVVLNDLLVHRNDSDYCNNLMHLNAFDILFRYFYDDNNIISFFIKRIIDFKSRTIQSEPNSGYITIAL